MRTRDWDISPLIAMDTWRSVRKDLTHAQSCRANPNNMNRWTSWLTCKLLKKPWMSNKIKALMCPVLMQDWIEWVRHMAALTTKW